MAYFDTKDKKRGLAGTIIVHLIILILFAIYGLTYPTPRPESGMLLNLGSTSEGYGEIQPDEVGETAEDEPISEDQPTESNPSESTDINNLTQDQTETIEVPPKKDSEKEAEKTPVENPNSKDSDSEKKPVEQEKTIDPKLKDALKDAFKKSGGSEGDDKDKTGDKGKTGGDPDGNSYTGGTGGSGNGQGYDLGNRLALEKIKPVYQCEEYGVVVVSIRVDRSGKTLSAKLELRGSTNTAPCLVNKAKEAAMKTKWQPDLKAPEMQYGSITYHFDLN